MTTKHVNIGVVFGGMSAEHEVSWLSARNVVQAMDPQRYSPVPVLIDREGGWHLLEPEVLEGEDPGALPGAGVPSRAQGVLLDPEQGKLSFVLKADGSRAVAVEVLFPMVHGPYGEDGTLQGLCKLYRIPFVGPGVLASAACMDKEVMKRLLLEHDIPVSRFVVVAEKPRTAEEEEKVYNDLLEQLGAPLFVKPANLGSSVGISKVDSEHEFGRALALAFRFDEKVVVEEFVEGREVECSVLGNKDPIASVPGEIIPRHEFYSYEAKYLDPEGADLRIPADLTEEVAQKVKALAVESFVAMGCEGMARVDLFVRPDGRVLINELNTIPGFTNISMYPKLWEASGMPSSELVHRLVQLGLERFQKEAKYSSRRETDSR